MSENKVRGAIMSRFRNESDLASQLGWPRQRLNRFVNGLAEPKVSDVKAMADALQMNLSELTAFFLEQQSPNGNEEGAEECQGSE